MDRHRGQNKRGRNLRLVNGQLSPEYAATRGDLSGLLARSFDATTKASLRTTLIATAAFAERNGMSLEVSDIPAGISASSINLDKHSMRSLFERGRSRSASGEAWSPVATRGLVTAVPSTDAAATPR